MIKAINLNKIYYNGGRQLHVLKDINLEVCKSEFAVITGPSGAGKSTLLHLLAGLDTPSGGNVIFNKTDLCRISDERRAEIRNMLIGFVFQFYYLMPEFTILENTMMPALISRQIRNKKTRKQIEEKAKSLLAALGLTERLTHRPAELSGGEQQRVAIARALINSPQIIYCDEPTGNLDSKTGSEVMRVLLDLNRQDGVTCIMVTHEEGLSRDADRVFHMKDGRIL